MYYLSIYSSCRKIGEPRIDIEKAIEVLRLVSDIVKHHTVNLVHAKTLFIIKVQQVSTWNNLSYTLHPSGYLNIKMQAPKNVTPPVRRLKALMLVQRTTL